MAYVNEKEPHLDVFVKISNGIKIDEMDLKRHVGKELSWSTLEEAIGLHIVRVEIYELHKGCAYIFDKAQGRAHFCRSLPRRSSGHRIIEGCRVQIFQTGCQHWKRRI
uniref:AlNc14C429G11578 protein n=1 Tax=Albugo laibachii Nc14 TaxID=890382 RepID=F0WZI6_9STRA|nr:AlNc14C429G11578 [Albugo laibachii Nc14]|eukprot:CCA26910.1 AlNc14C429G11578 [Albugo laibachii Nc14]